MSYQNAVVIGRFQPFHLGHADLLRTALAQAERVCVVLGGSHQPRTAKNPFTADERARMIRSWLADEGISQALVEITGVRDYLYNDALWVAELQERVRSRIGRDGSTVLVGHKKDDSSYYLDLFPNWHFCGHSAAPIDLDGVETVLSATDVRRKLFEGRVWEHLVPHGTLTVLAELLTGPTADTFRALEEEYHYLRDYPKQWGKGPFVTTDAVVMCQGHVLVIERGQAPGKGLLALPGGFLNVDERIEDGAIRELCEETSICQTLGYDAESLKQYVRDRHVFDHPARSSRGRIITHAFLLNVPLCGNGFLPPVGGGDDAAKAMWLPLADILSAEERFYEDHLSIIRYFVARV